MENLALLDTDFQIFDFKQRHCFRSLFLVLRSAVRRVSKDVANNLSSHPSRRPLTRPPQDEVYPTDPFQRDRDQLLRFHREFHRQLLQHVLHKAVDDEADGFFLAEAALDAVEQHVLGDFRRRRFVLEVRRRILRLDIGHGVRAAFVADQERVAGGEVARAGRLAMRGDEPAIGVLRHAGRDALGDDPARRVLAEMDHLGAAIDLLVTVRDRDRIELAARIVAAQDAARIFPGDRRPGLDLGPGDLRIVAAAVATLGDEIVDAADALGIAGVPVLHRRIFDLGVVERDQFDHGGMQLVLVALRRGAAFEIADVSALVGDDQRALELAGVALVDAEIGRQLHRAAHARRHVDERAVGEHRRVQRREVIVRGRHDRAEILLHQLGMLADRFRDRHEDHAGVLQFLLERGGDRNRVRTRRRPRSCARLPA